MDGTTATAGGSGSEALLKITFVRVECEELRSELTS